MPGRSITVSTSRSVPSASTRVARGAPSSSSARSADPARVLGARLAPPAEQKERGHRRGHLDVGVRPTCHCLPATSRRRPASRGRPGCPWCWRRAAAWATAVRWNGQPAHATTGVARTRRASAPRSLSGTPGASSAPAPRRRGGPRPTACAGSQQSVVVRLRTPRPDRLRDGRGVAGLLDGADEQVGRR